MKTQLDMGKANVMAPTSIILMSQVTNSAGFIDFDKVASLFWMTKGQLAQTIGLTAPAISKSDRQTAVRTQGRVREMLEILAHVREWAGGDIQAMAWYRSQPIPALDGRTPEALVKAGQAAAVRGYLDHLALGGFA
jgi:uncharacterized protein (DUF2384 family)